MLMKIPLEFTMQDTPETFGKKFIDIHAKLFIGNFKAGMYEVSIEKPTRTPRQNRCIHALFPDLAVELDALGVENRKGKLDIPWNEIEAKEFFIYAFNNGKRTSKSTTKEIADATRRCLDAINAKGGQLAIKDKGLTELLKNN